MSLFLALLAGCSNLGEAPVWGGGGARYASGYAATPGDDDTGADTGYVPVEGAPNLITGSASYAYNEAEQLYIEAGVAYEDDPDDVAGGRLYYELLGDGEVLTSDDRGIVEEDPNGNTEALVAGGTISFSVGPVDEGVTHAVSVYVVDYTRNTSNEITVEVTGR